MSDLKQSKSEEAVLSERGYKLTKKIGEGSYAKVILKIVSTSCFYCFLKGEKQNYQEKFSLLRVNEEKRNVNGSPMII